jgi:hypothetical protein
MSMTQESSVGDGNLGWRIKNMSNFNNKISTNVTRFRISGSESNPLMSIAHHINDVNQLCEKYGILAVCFRYEIICSIHTKT